MRRREGVLVLGLLIVVAVLGIGYAALTGSLQIVGTAELLKDNSNLVVHFTGTPTGAVKSGTCDNCSATTLAINASDDTQGDLDITGFKKVGDAYEATFTVTNDSPNAGTTAYVTATASMTGINASYFTVTTDWGSTEQTIAKDGSKTIKVTVTLNQLYTGSESSLSAGISVQLSASTVSSN